MAATRWYVIAEAVPDGEAVARHRIPARDAAATPDDDPARAQAQAWAREYSSRTGAPTTIDVLLLDEHGNVLSTAPDGFYYDPRYPDRDPYEQYGY
jgi:hypothetical protein